LSNTDVIEKTTTDRTDRIVNISRGNRKRFASYPRRQWRQVIENNTQQHWEFRDAVKNQTPQYSGSDRALLIASSPEKIYFCSRQKPTNQKPRSAACCCRKPPPNTKKSW